MKIKKLVIRTKTEEYPIIIGSNLVKHTSKILKKNNIIFNKCLLVIDKNVPKKIILEVKKSFKKEIVYNYYLKANEKNKNQNSAFKILKVLLNKNFSRNDLLITVGGGITGDIGGFAASLFKRGIQLANVPTTLLSQVDSSIGGKTGVNTLHGKNLIGTFYQPKLVISDIRFLSSLPKREVVCGYAEILKHSLILNKKFFIFLDKNVKNILNLESPFIEKAIYESCKIKKKVVEKDENEKNFRKILNFGHTFAHAYEASLGYSKKLNHGEAVLLGMHTALKFGLKNRFVNLDSYIKIKNHYLKANLPFEIKKKIFFKNINNIISFMTKDKKNNSNKISLILLKKIGSLIIERKFSKKRIESFFKKELKN